MFYDDLLIGILIGWFLGGDARSVSEKPSIPQVVQVLPPQYGTWPREAADDFYDPMLDKYTRA